MKKHPQSIPVFFFILMALVTFTNSAHADADPATTGLSETPAQIEAKVRELFKNTPVMIKIARCESEFRQFTDSGSVLRGGSAGGMIGVFQFFESIHAPVAKTLGFDLATVDGNLAYAKHLYTSEGTAPWAPARSCWETAVSAEVVTKSISVAQREKLIKQIVLLKKLIALLQKQLAAVE